MKEIISETRYDPILESFKSQEEQHIKEEVDNLLRDRELIRKIINPETCKWPEQAMEILIGEVIKKIGEKSVVKNKYSSIESEEFKKNYKRDEIERCISERSDLIEVNKNDDKGNYVIRMKDVFFAIKNNNPKKNLE